MKNKNNNAYLLLIKIWGFIHINQDRSILYFGMISLGEVVASAQYILARNKTNGKIYLKPLFINFYQDLTREIGIVSFDVSLLMYCSNGWTKKVKN